jgi:hypothetical protein
LPQGGEGWRFVLYAIALLIIMLLRQQGLLGGKEWGFLKPTRWPLTGKLGGGGGSGSTPEPVREPLPVGARSVATPGSEVEAR